MSISELIICCAGFTVQGVGGCVGKWVGEGVDGYIGNEHKDDLSRLETLALRSLTATRRKTA